MIERTSVLQHTGSNRQLRALSPCNDCSGPAMPFYALQVVNESPEGRTMASFPV